MRTYNMWGLIKTFLGMGIEYSSTSLRLSVCEQEKHFPNPSFFLQSNDRFMHARTSTIKGDIQITGEAKFFSLSFETEPQRGWGKNYSPAKEYNYQAPHIVSMPLHWKMTLKPLQNKWFMTSKVLWSGEVSWFATSLSSMNVIHTAYFSY